MLRQEVKEKKLSNIFKQTTQNDLFVRIHTLIIYDSLQDTDPIIDFLTYQGKQEESINVQRWTGSRV